MQKPCKACSCFLGMKETIKLTWLSLCAPAQAVLKINGLLLCGAVLLDTSWIVSAAHCFDNIRNWVNITVVMGRYGPSLASGLRASAD